MDAVKVAAAACNYQQDARRALKCRLLRWENWYYLSTIVAEAYYERFPYSLDRFHTQRAIS